ncbi:MAG: ABC transporter permease DevC [Gomphosphaeria aponina SAG 52.96 = DSM 107014]|uniref:ABC transporter permease DevC n=1 Tax=Gomphosphaeria aponina SAG 52.96 = DSM 107014 TaxID=1521640 RepID=A0A941GXR0_9CHRO|nr:ABC transporter permease DevC [Gomphosphaeria aponina SAG 52.96 = DSM 107014]
MKTPLSWLQLTHEKVRLLVAIAGICFADFLMFMQLGFRDALFDSAVILNEAIDGEIFLLSPQSDALIAMKSFSSRPLYAALGVEGVKSVTPIYLDFAIWKNPVNRKTRSILVLGFNPSKNIFNLPGINEENLAKIKLQDVVIFDELSRPEFGPIPELFQAGKTVKTEVGDRAVEVQGLFSLGTSFAADSNIFTSDLNFLRIFPQREKGIIDIGVIKLAPDADLEAVLNTLREKIAAGDVIVLSKEEYIEREKKYWQNGTAIGFIFALGTGMGFVVGTVIVYQILYTDVADHLPEYATLKAMGYTNNYLLGVVFQEAIILALIGFIPGFALSVFFYLNAASATGLPMIMTVSRAGTVLILTVGMCAISGSVAVGKLRAADPADIF